MNTTRLTAADDSSIALWRSEALNALCSTEEYVTKKRNAIEDIVLEGKDFLGSLVLKDSDRAFTSFEHDVIEAAISFDRTMRQSTTNYYFIFEPQSKQVPQGHRPLSSPQTGQLLFLSCFEMAAVIDITTGKKFTSKSIVEIDDHGPIGQKALNIYPALCCRRGKSELILGKQLILADLSSLPRRKTKDKTASGV